MFCLFFCFFLLCFLKRKQASFFCHFLLLFRNLTPKNIIIFNNTRERKNKKNNVIRLREQSDVLLFSLLQKIFIVSSERSAFKLRLIKEF